MQFITEIEWKNKFETMINAKPSEKRRVFYFQPIYLGYIVFIINHCFSIHNVFC